MKYVRTPSGRSKSRRASARRVIVYAVVDDALHPSLAAHQQETRRKFVVVGPASTPDVPRDDPGRRGVVGVIPSWRFGPVRSLR